MNIFKLIEFLKYYLNTAKSELLSSLPPYRVYNPVDLSATVGRLLL